MNSQSSIEHHHGLQESRADVYAVEVANGIPLPTDQFDRAVMLHVERGGVRSNQARPRKAA
ncbi:hypothetical protein [Shinella pollutisoli]|uniref:Uncharacterized protein n=1 Tax=Shinella pollutisoli TaxID=2250594 RepID=A0ABV7DDP1_9HYPH|nr:hypothetical protein [Shinella pollutisoli]